MSEQEIIKMEPEEYMEYLRNQVKKTPEQEQHPIAQISMYQMNKDLVQGLKKMNNMDVNRALEKVAEWFDLKETHYALLNHEHHYFTIFEYNVSCHEPEKAQQSFIKEIKDVLMNYYGDHDLRAIDVDNNGAVEIWAMWDKEPTVAYLFPYSQGVVYY